MSLLRPWLRAEFGARWRSHVALALLGGLIGAFVLTGAAGARRTASAFDRYSRTQRIPQLEVQADTDGTSLRRVVAHAPHVVAAGTYAPFLAGPRKHGFTPGQSFVVFAASDASYAREIDRPTLLRGRYPRPGAADEVAVGEKVRRSAGLDVGTRVRLASISPKELEALAAGDTSDIKFRGPSPTVRIVGVIRTRLDLGEVGYAPNYFYATPAFFEQNNGRMGLFGELLDVRLDDAASIPAFTRYVKAHLPSDPESLSMNRVDQGLSGVRDATRVQALALLLVALAAAVAGTVAFGQAVARTAGELGSSYPVLRALGVTRAGRDRLTAAVFVPVAVGSAVLAVLGAWVASRWFPTGLAARSEVHPGVAFDATVLLGGAVLIAAGSLVAAVVGARTRSGAALDVDSGRVMRLDQLSASLPPAVATGVRWAIPRSGQPRYAHTAIVGTIIGVAGLAAALTFGRSMERLVDKPQAWGWTFDVDAGGGDDPTEIAARRDRLLANAAVGDVAVVRIVASAIVGGHEMQGYAYRSTRGSIDVALVDGRAAATPDEVVLGTKTARALGVDIGDVVRAPTDNGRRIALRVVGTGTFPTIETDRFTTGVAMTPSGLERLRTSDGYQEVVFRWKPGADVAAATKQLRTDFDLEGAARAPADVTNLKRVRNYPFVLAAFLTAVAALAVLHSVVVSTRRRRRQVGVLRTIGFTGRHIRSAVTTQAFVPAIVGCLLGIPIGIAAGRWTWALVADRLGVRPVVATPTPAVLAVALGTVVITLLVGWVSGDRAARFGVARALRAE